MAKKNKQPNTGATDEGDGPTTTADWEKQKKENADKGGASEQTETAGNLNKDEREPAKPASDATASVPGEAPAPAPQPAPAVAADTKPTPPPKSERKPTVGASLRLFGMEFGQTARWGQTKRIHPDGKLDIQQDGGPMREGLDLYDVLDDQQRQALIENHGGQYVWAEHRPPE